MSHEKGSVFKIRQVGQTPGLRGTPSFRLREYPAMPRADWAVHNREVTQPPMIDFGNRFRIYKWTSQNRIDESIIPVTYIAQPDERTCWNASYKMMLDYRSMGRWNSKADNLPNDAQMRARGIYNSELRGCRDGLLFSSTNHKAFLTADSILRKS